MRVGTADRRVERTQRLLRAALLSLIAERGYERLTVQAILDRADSGRTTFYAHFCDKQDLLEYGLATLVASFARQMQAVATTHATPAAHILSLAVSVMQHAVDHRTLYAAMVEKPSGTLVIGQIERELCSLVATCLTQHIAAGGLHNHPCVAQMSNVIFAPNKHDTRGHRP